MNKKISELPPPKQWYRIQKTYADCYEIIGPTHDSNTEELILTTASKEYADDLCFLLNFARSQRLYPQTYSDTHIYGPARF